MGYTIIDPTAPPLATEAAEVLQTVEETLVAAESNRRSGSLVLGLAIMILGLAAIAAGLNLFLTFLRP